MTEDYKLPDKGSWVSWLSFFFGWVVIAFGVWTMFQKIGPNNPTYSFGLALGFNIAHDAVVAPLACLVGYLVSKVVPHRLHAQVSWGLFASAIVIGIGYAPLRGLGRKPDNATIEPLNYTTSVLTVLIVVWLIVAALIAVPVIRRRRLQSSATDTASQPVDETATETKASSQIFIDLQQGGTDK